MEPTAQSTASADSQVAQSWATDTSLQKRIEVGFLKWLFLAAYYCPWFTRLTRPLCVSGAWVVSRSIREGTGANAARILGKDSTLSQRTKLAKRVVGRFYDFICEFGQSMRMDIAKIDQSINEIHGKDYYFNAIEAGKGIILATAHLGSFERGMVALKRFEKPVHVLFQRDQEGGFEKLRKQQREQLSIIETPVGDGVGTWMRLRDVLTDGGVVLIQIDRVMPGQVGVPVPFFDGHLQMPVGAIKLAMATGSPILPVFSVCRPDGDVDIFMESPAPMPDPPQRVGPEHPAMCYLASTLQGYVKQYPEQWLMLEKAWVEDRKTGS